MNSIPSSSKFQIERGARSAIRPGVLLLALIIPAVSATCLAAPPPLTITTTSCPGGTQLQSYRGCRIEAAGGVPPYQFTIDNSGNYPSLPEGLSLNQYTGEIWGPIIGGEGSYTVNFIVTDSASNQASAQITFAMNGNNAYMARIFPPDSIFHHRVDAATTGLPVDTSPAASIPSAYLTAKIHPAFGGSPLPFPNGIPGIEVPWYQPNVAVSTTVYQSYFTEGPIPYFAPVEGSAFSYGNDQHVLVYRQAGPGYRPGWPGPESGQSGEGYVEGPIAPDPGPNAPPRLYEMWQGIYEGGPWGGPWTDSSNALWINADTNQLTPQSDGPSPVSGTADAAGLPVSPLLVTADEVIGYGTPTNPKGVIRHPIRFTLEHMVNYWVWPATATSGLGECTNSSGAVINTYSEIYQPSPQSPADLTPASCTRSAPAGEIYRLMASVPNPPCAATSPQAAIVIQGMRDYGIILADNGSNGFIIGTPDARWNDADLACIKDLTLADFEPVNTSSLMVSTDSGRTTGPR
jgi:hypothetical protein